MTNYVEFGLAYPELHQLIFGIQRNNLTDNEVMWTLLSLLHDASSR